MVAFLCYLITQFLLITKVLFLVGQAVEVEAEQGEAHHYLILRLLTVWAEVVGGLLVVQVIALYRLYIQLHLCQLRLRLQMM